MKLPLLWFSVLCLLFPWNESEASTILRPTLGQLVKDADYIIVGEVQSKRSFWKQTDRGNTVYTEVVFRVERSLKGQVVGTHRLEMAGGQVGTQSVQIDGSPQFIEGRRYVLFGVSNPRTFIPVVAFRYGVFNVLKDRRGVERVLDNRGGLITALRDIGPRVARAIRAEKEEDLQRTVSLAEFAAAIRERVQVGQE